MNENGKRRDERNGRKTYHANKNPITRLHPNLATILLLDGIHAARLPERSQVIARQPNTLQHVPEQLRIRRARSRLSRQLLDSSQVLLPLVAEIKVHSAREALSNTRHARRHDRQDLPEGYVGAA